MKHYALMPDAASAMTLQGILREKDIPSTMAPTPREADHCCGVCILYEQGKDKEKIARLAIEAGITVDQFWDTENRDDPHRHRFL